MSADIQGACSGYSTAADAQGSSRAAAAVGQEARDHNGRQSGRAGEQARSAGAKGSGRRVYRDRFARGQGGCAAVPQTQSPGISCDPGAVRGLF